MRHRVAAFLVALVPEVAWSADVTDTARALGNSHSIEFSSGATAELYGKVRVVAIGLIFFFYVVSLILEAFKPEGEPKLLPPTLRAAYVGVALALYPMLTGTVVRTMNGLAARLGSDDESWFQKVEDLQTRAALDPSGRRPPNPNPRGKAGTAPSQNACPKGLVVQATEVDVICGDSGCVGKPGWRCVIPEVVKKDESFIASGLKDAVLEASLLVIFSICSLSRWIIEQVGAILTGVFYILGPLALAAGVLRVTGTISSWAKNFITYASWPVFTALLMRLLMVVTAEAVAKGTGYAHALVVSLAMMISMISAPVLASAIIGGAGAGFMSGAIGAAAGWVAGHDSKLMGAAGQGALHLASGGGAGGAAGAALKGLGPVGAVAAALGQKAMNAVGGAMRAGVARAGGGETPAVSTPPEGPNAGTSAVSAPPSAASKG